jgi:hypothetical protein
VKCDVERFRQRNFFVGPKRDRPSINLLTFAPDQKTQKHKNKMESFLVFTVFLILLTVVEAAPLISGVKATFSNPLNPSQTFTALLSKSRVLTYNNRNDSENPAWDCQLSQRNCYHWDELHDWGTFNISVTLEGYVNLSRWTIPGRYQTALSLLPDSCAQVYLNGSLVQDQCGYPKFVGGANASHVDWRQLRETVIDYAEDELNPIAVLAKSTLNTLNWVSSFP